MGLDSRLSAKSAMAILLLALCLQMSCCNVGVGLPLGVSPVQTAYGDLKVKQQHMMVATYGLVKPDDAIIMSRAHTFDGR